MDGFQNNRSDKKLLERPSTVRTHDDLVVAVETADIMRIRRLNIHQMNVKIIRIYVPGSLGNDLSNASNSEVPTIDRDEYSFHACAPLVVRKP